MTIKHLPIEEYHMGLGLLREFLLLDPDDHLEWWHDQHLPHPGCPELFKCVVGAFISCHDLTRVGDSLGWITPERQQSLIYLKETSIRVCSMFGLFYKGERTIDRQRPSPLITSIHDTQIERISCHRFHSSYKGREILVPIDEEFITEIILVRLLLGERFI